MATKGEHEKPEAVEHQPIAKKVRLDEDAKVAEDVKKVKIDEDATPQPEVGGSGSASPESVKEENVKEEKLKEEKPNTIGSAFGGFAAFSGKNAFAGFSAPTDSNGFGTKASTEPFSGFGSCGFEDSKEKESTTSTGGFASFQNKAPMTFASFAAKPEGFGSTTTDLSEIDVVKKPEPVVPALTEAELANGEEDERILVEKRTKLFKLVEKNYAEVGIGPLRVLDAKDAKSEDGKSSARIVMRRESYPRGPGTKLLINASLSSCLLCERKTEKTMLLTVLEANEDPEADQKFSPVTYLMRFGTPEDLDVVLARIQCHMHPSTPVSS